MVGCIFFFVILSSPFWPSSALNSYVELDWQSTIPHTWSYNDLILNETKYGDGSSTRFILKTESSSQFPSFACGFICTGTCDSHFLAVVVLGESTTSTITDQQKGFPGIVWLANRDNPIGKDGTLNLTFDGGLVLQDSDGTNVWSTSTSGKSVIGMLLEKTGNLLLYDRSNRTVWQSFDFPTDALLPGQRLFGDHRLVASASGKNWQSGRYYAQMNSTGLAVFVRADAPSMYFQLVLDPSSGRWNSTANRYTRGCQPGYQCRSGLDTLVNGSRSDFPVNASIKTYAALYGESLVLFNDTIADGFPVTSNSTARSYHYVRLGYDGHLRAYQWRKTEVYDFVAQRLDNCQFPHRCGDYGVCDNGGNCNCPKAPDGSDYFKPKAQSSNDGCSEIIPLSCHSPLDRHRLVDFGSLSYFNFIDSDGAIPKLKDVEGCKQACLKNCTCRAAFFKYGSNNSHGHCYLLSKILTMRSSPIPGGNYFYSSAFIKVQLPIPNKTHLATIISGSVATTIVVILSALCIVISRKKKKEEESEDEGEEYFKQVMGMPKRFSYQDLRVATEDFKEKLGGGGFGSVFKGILEDGMEIAVKRLDNTGQGVKEFLAEVETIGSIHHFNLVRLIGFCAERSCRLLVYEYMSNGSLDKWIFDRDKNLVLDWQTRKKIIFDVAKGLAYLHEECRQRIVHLDIKPQNILMDDHFNAKISDFGLSMLMGRDQSQVQTTMRGTPGYLAPEWEQLRITLKVDVYSFGIVILEIVCGRKNLDRSRSEPSKHLLRMLQEKAEEKHLIHIIDGSIADMELHGEEAMKMIKLAAWCLQDDHTRRPLMSMVVRVLEGAMDVEPEISYRFCNAMTRKPTTRADFHIFSDPQQASELSAPR